MAGLTSTSHTSCLFQPKSSFHRGSASVQCGSYRRQWATSKIARTRCHRYLLSSRQSVRKLQLHAMMDEGELVPDVDEGTKVKITKEILVYHAPKVKELQLQGMEGTVKNIVKKYKGKETSANLPYRIEFSLEKDDGKQQKFFAHVAASEFEKVE